MKEFTVTTQFGKTRCTMSASKYADRQGHIALQLWCEDGPFATITVNLGGIGEFEKNVSAVDTNNCPWAPALIKRLNIGTPTGEYVRSGFCAYPLYTFDLERIREYTGREWK